MELHNLRVTQETRQTGNRSDGSIFGLFLLLMPFQAAVDQPARDVVDHGEERYAHDMPNTPYILPKSRMENSTQKLLTPVVFPRIFGPMRLPSSCWRITIKIRKMRHWKGLFSSRRRAQGMAPMKGPKKGMIYTLFHPLKIFSF